MIPNKTFVFIIWKFKHNPPITHVNKGNVTLESTPLETEFSYDNRWGNKVSKRFT